MMCVEGGESPVEEDPEQQTLKVNFGSWVGRKELEVHLEVQPEQSLSLQDWINSEIQLPMTENQLCTNEV